MYDTFLYNNVSCQLCSKRTRFIVSEFFEFPGTAIFLGYLQVTVSMSFCCQNFLFNVRFFKKHYFHSFFVNMKFKNKNIFLNLILEQACNFTKKNIVMAPVFFWIFQNFSSFFKRIPQVSTFQPILFLPYSGILFFVKQMCL